MKLIEIIHEFYDDLQEFLISGPFQKMEDQYIPYLTTFEQLSKESFSHLLYLSIDEINRRIVTHKVKELIPVFIHEDSLEEANRLYEVYQIILTSIKSQ